MLLFNVHSSVWLITLFLALVPFGTLAFVPMAIMACFGLRLIMKGRVDWNSPVQKLFTYLFLCFWLPILFSLPDAVNYLKTFRVALFYGACFLSGLYMISSLVGDQARRAKVLNLCGVVVSFWVLDALVQAVIGYDLFGFYAPYGAINGLFGEQTPKLGVFLAATTPILFSLVFVSRYRILFLLLCVGSLSVVFLSGRRSGWVAICVVLLCYGISYLRSNRQGALWKILCGSIVLTLLGGFLYTSFPYVSVRVDRSLLVFSGDLSSVDNAIGKRLPIWNVALEMIKSNPINGVGARGFRYAYNDYAVAGDPFIDAESEIGAYQTHQLILDLLCNTGLLGLLGFLGFCWLAIFYWLKGNVLQKAGALPYGVALAAVFFPINSHFAIYSSQWSAFLFWLIALYIAHILSTDSGSSFEGCPKGLDG